MLPSLLDSSVCRCIPYDYLTNPHLASDFWAIQTLMTK